eukprot:scaffold8094_cov376-Prasinococcus_capsulatus_cf.AAC.6
MSRLVTRCAGRVGWTFPAAARNNAIGSYVPARRDGASVPLRNAAAARHSAAQRWPRWPGRPRTSSSAVPSPPAASAPCLAEPPSHAAVAAPPSRTSPPTRDAVRGAAATASRTLAQLNQKFSQSVLPPSLRALPPPRYSPALRPCGCRSCTRTPAAARSPCGVSLQAAYRGPAMTTPGGAVPGSADGGGRE